MRRKLFRATLLILLASGFLAVPHSTSASGPTPAAQSITTYYSDATHTKVVGQIQVTCTQIIRTGTVTAYFTRVILGRC